MDKKVIYLDNAATTKVMHKAALSAMLAMENTYGNPAAVHEFGKEAEAIVESSRGTIMKCLGTDKGTVVFTSGGTESINWALNFCAEKNKRFGKHIVSTMIEHAATLETLKHLKEIGYEITLVAPQKDGSVSLDSIKSAIREDTILLSLMAVCNETGAVLPIAYAAQYAKSVNKNIFVHIDAVQGFMKIPLCLKDIDFLSISAHKIGGMKGVGALYIKDGIKMTPWLYGGYQDKKLRSGTQAVPQIASFAKAAEVHYLSFEDMTGHMEKLRQYLVKRLKEIDGAVVVEPSDTAPHIVNAGFGKGRSEVIIRVLSDMGIYVAGGSACSKGKKSHVLSAMGISPKLIDSSLRISLSEENTKEEIDIFIDGLKTALKMFG